ncbi:hypothetical protein EUX53_11395 [Pseudomonas orientalis]|nr:hypothetical protein EUX53_11395 [Pseudomonas orientalis]
MLAKNLNDNARFLNQRGACEFFASKLAPTLLGKPPPTLDPCFFKHKKTALTGRRFFVAVNTLLSSRRFLSACGRSRHVHP